eukprot:2100939-Rhodomonas_salina.1
MCIRDRSLTPPLLDLLRLLSSAPRDSESGRTRTSSRRLVQIPLRDVDCMTVLMLESTFSQLVRSRPAAHHDRTRPKCVMLDSVVEVQNFLRVGMMMGLVAFRLGNLTTVLLVLLLPLRLLVLPIGFLFSGKQSRSASAALIGDLFLCGRGQPKSFQPRTELENWYWPAFWRTPGRVGCGA